MTPSADRFFEAANAFVPNREGADVVRPIKESYYFPPQMNIHLVMPWSFFGLTPSTTKAEFERYLAGFGTEGD